MIIREKIKGKEKKARAVGVIFQSWEDSQPLDVIMCYTENSHEYEPGFFYERELSCIQELLKLTDINHIHTIVVDGPKDLPEE